MPALTAFLGFTSEEFGLISRYRPLLEADATTLAQDFYRYLLAHPITAAVFHDFSSERLDALILKQADHARALLESRLDDQWQNAMLAIGRKHHDFGIQPSWIAGAYILYWRHWQKVVHTQVPAEEREVLQDALFRLLVGDLMIQLEGCAQANCETDTERQALFQVLLKTLTDKEDGASAIDGLLNKICDCLPRKSCGVTFAGYAVRHIAEGPLRWEGGAKAHLHSDEIPPIPGDPCWEALREQRPIVRSVDDPSVPAWLQALQNRAEEIGCFPFGAEGLQGVGIVAARARGYFDRVGAIYFDAFASLGELVLRLRGELLRDPLTHLPNRLVFRDRLVLAREQTMRREGLLAIGILDLDEFKKINDRLGHSAGDRFLEAIATRIQDVLRGGDTLARLGGDEFGLLLPDLRSVDDLETLASRVLEAVRTPLELDDEVVHPSASLGLTVYPLDDSDDETLLRHADLALYAAKEGGRDRFRLHDLQMEESQRIAMGQRRLLETALEQGWLTLVYQPIVASADGMSGVEALLRIEHPDLGMIFPAAFFAALDHPHLARPVGVFVLNAAFAQTDRWRMQGHSWRVSINISTTHLLDACFLGDLQATLAKYPDLPPHQIEIEITESAPMRDLASAKSALQGCRNLGVRVALDDFGTGYTSLNYLHHLPAEVLKIDQSFVQDILDDPKDLAIVTAVVTAGRMLGYEVVAEGVETEDQMRLLIQMGCSHLQGYHLSHPMPPEEVCIWAKKYGLTHQEYGTYALDVLPTILQAQHLRVAQFLRALRSEAPVPGELLEANAEERCHLGLWLRGDGLHRFGDTDLFSGIQRRHERLHGLAREARDLLEQGDREGALRLGEQIETENHQVVLELMSLVEMRP